MKKFWLAYKDIGVFEILKTFLIFMMLLLIAAWIIITFGCVTSKEAHAVDFKSDDKYVYIRDGDLCAKLPTHLDLTFFSPTWMEWSQTVSAYNWPIEVVSIGECVGSYTVKPSFYGDTRPLYDQAKLVNEGVKVKIGRVAVGTTCTASPNVRDYRPVAGGMAICTLK